MYNTDTNQKNLYKTLYSKTKKYCIGYVLNQKKLNVDFSKLENSKITAKYNKTDKYEEKEIDLQKWNLKPDDEEIIKILSSYVELGYNNKQAFEYTARDLDIDIEELMYMIEVIKNQIINKENNMDYELQNEDDNIKIEKQEEKLEYEER